MTQPLADVRVHSSPARTVVTIVGEVDLSNADALQQQLLGAAQQTEGRALVVDLSGLQYMDSRGVRVLYELARARGTWDLVIVAPADSAAGQLLDITRMADLVPVLASVPEA
jgi:anti-anti-sigma factor